MIAMDIVHVEVTFRDKFSGATERKVVTRSKDTFDKMRQSIGQIVRRFENNIGCVWEVIKVEQSKNQPT